MRAAQNPPDRLHQSSVANEGGSGACLPLFVLVAQRHRTHLYACINGRLDECRVKVTDLFAVSRCTFREKSDTRTLFEQEADTPADQRRIPAQGAFNENSADAPECVADQPACQPLAQ